MGAYIDGSRENLDTMDKMLLNLEQNPSNLDAVEEIFRAAHTLKGMSATMGFEKIAHLTHEMENILDKLRNQEIPVTTEVIDIIFETFDVLRTLVNDSIESTDSNVDLTEISAKLKAIGTGETTGSAPGTPATEPAAAAEAAPTADSGQKSQEQSSELAEFELNDFELSGLEAAGDDDRKVFMLKISLVSDCLLKGPRIFMVLRTLDDFHCDIIKSIPEVKDLENERFDTSFKMIIISDQNRDQIIEGIESISEIETIQLIDISNSLEEGLSAPPLPPPPPAAPGPAPEEAEPTPVHIPSPPPAAARQAAPQPASQPTRQSAEPAATPEFQEQVEGAAEEDDEENKEIIEMVQLVTFGMAGETYALEIRQVEAIINLVPITRVPKAPPHIDGVINLRGEIVPVINTRRRLKLPTLETTDNYQIIILAFENEKVKAGFMVDNVAEVIRLPETAIEPPSRVSDGVDIDYLKGVGKLDNKIIILLNAQRIVFGKNTEEQ
jgi:two-component system chemotaxis sensor kinase CheA